MKVVAVLLHHNNLAGIRQVIDAVRGQTRPVDDVVLVDNGSQEAVRTALRGIPDIHLLFQENRGVGAGHNAGWRFALDELGADYIWALEHDAVPFPDCLEILLSEAHRHGSEVWALHPIEINHLDFDRFAYFSLTSRGLARVIDKTKLDNYFGGLSFNGLLLPATTIRKVGWLREDFFVGMEDIDFYTRIYAHGGKCLRVPRARVYHDGYKNRREWRIGRYVFLLSWSTPMRDFYATRNGYILMMERGVGPSRLYVRLFISLIKALLLGPERIKRMQLKLKAYYTAKRMYAEGTYDRYRSTP